MNSSTAGIIQFFSLLTLIGDGIAILLLIAFGVDRIEKGKQKFIQTVLEIPGENAVSLAFLVATGATIGSLTLSEVAKLAPCQLCWFQRIFMFPQMIILLVALIKNDNSVKRYILSLSVVGLAISVYHILLQIYPDVLHCSDETVSCAKKEFVSFGYITIPVMSATAFMLVILLMLIANRRKAEDFSGSGHSPVQRRSGKSH